MAKRSITRRHFILAGGGGLAVAAGGLWWTRGRGGAGPASPGEPSASAAPSPSPGAGGLVIAPEKDLAGSPGVGLVDVATGRHLTVSTGIVGHSVVGDPIERNVIVMFGQRPERRSCAIDLDSARVLKVFESAEDRHFYGHGSFAADGSLLYAAENNYDDGTGLITVRDGRTFEPLGELPSHGFEPHEILPVGDGKTLLIAHGGVRTDPIKEEPLSFDVMEPSLVYVDAASGKLVDKLVLANNTLGIRHLALTRAGDVAVGIKQFKLPVASTVAVRHQGGPLTLLPAGPDLARRMAGLALSVVIHEPTLTVGATHPTGNIVTFWSLRDQRLLRMVEVPAPEGITVTADARHFLVTTQSGRVRLFGADSLTEEPFANERVRGLNHKHACTWQA